MELRKRQEQEKFLKIDGRRFKKVYQFSYLGSSLSSNSGLLIDIKERIAAGSRSLYSFRERLSTKSVSANTKMKIHNTLICPIASLARLRNLEINQARTRKITDFCKKSMRRIWEAVHGNEEWRRRRRKQEELYRLLQQPTILQEKKGRII